MFDDVYIYVPSEQQIIKISEGSGDNLSEEDMAEGYVDYIYYEQLKTAFLQFLTWLSVTKLWNILYLSKRR